MNGGRSLDARAITLTREQAERMCFGKFAYNSIRHAGNSQAWLKRRMEEKGERFDPQRIYHCPVCGLYHTTSRREIDVI
jgi:hypothetical protein